MNNPISLTKIITDGVSTCLKRYIDGVWQKIQAAPNWTVCIATVAFLMLLAVLGDPDIHSLKDLFSRRFIGFMLQQAESIAILLAVVLYFKEAQERRDKNHYESYQVIDQAAAAGVPTSYARKKALENLNKGKVSLSSLDAPGADLAKIQLPDVDLSYADLRGADLRRSNLHNARFHHSDLQGACLRWTNLERAKFWKTNLREADLRHSNLRKSTLTCSDLADVCFVDADLREASLFKSNLQGSNLENADLRWAILKGADLSDANLTGAKLLGADLSKARYCNTTMPDGRIRNSDCQRFKLFNN
jgi:uncharacterized protein YjbI with pentapeptide repeats